MPRRSRIQDFRADWSSMMNSSGKNVLFYRSEDLLAAAAPITSLKAR